jgi:hypothetical protein
MNEYCVAFPLWGLFENGDGPTFDETIVSPQTRDRLRRWAAAFNAGYDPLEGWPSMAACLRSFVAGRDLGRVVREELPDDVELSVDLWEFTVRGVEHSRAEVELQASRA